MLGIDTILSSTHSYKQAFAEGLTRIQHNQTAGTFILACANIFQHPELVEKNKTLLSKSYTYIKDYYQECNSNTCQPNDAADDISVMNQIIDINFENLEPLQTKKLETNTATFQLSFNQLRSFRPKRMSSVENTNLDTEFNKDGFHFDKEFLKKEMFAEGEYNGRKLSLLYNKFPFMEYHALLVIDKNLHHNQFLTKEYLDYIFQLQSSIEENIPDLVITYNSIGAGASVNHLHFQVFIETKPLAIFSPAFIHNGGLEAYPAFCCVFRKFEECWYYLQQLHTDNTPYNLLIKNGKIFCLPRKSPLKEFSDFNVSSYGWSEMAGTFTLNNKDVFKHVSINKLLETINSVSTHQD